MIEFFSFYLKITDNIIVSAFESPEINIIYCYIIYYYITIDDIYQYIFNFVSLIMLVEYALHSETYMLVE